MNKIKVMLFEIFPKLGKNIVDMLATIPSVEFKDNNVNNTEEALALILSASPDVIILGNDFPGMDGYFFTQMVRKEAAPTQVIMIAEIISAESVRQAMRAGACDFISYRKLTVEELTSALEHASQLADEERKIKTQAEEKIEIAAKQQAKPPTWKPARIITVYSPKGGVGVSTIVANLAHALNRKQRKVLVVDGDILFGDMEVLLNQRCSHSLADLVRFKDTLDDDVLRTVINQCDVALVASPPGPREGLEITGPIFENILLSLAQLDYDYLLVNTTSYLSETTIVALDRGDILILVGTQEITTIRALRLFLNLMGSMQLKSEKIALVVNRFDEKSILSLDQMDHRLEMKVAHAIPNDPKTVMQANNLGIPFVLDQEKSPASHAIVELAEIIQKESPGKVMAVSKLLASFKLKLRKQERNRAA